MTLPTYAGARPAPRKKAAKTRNRRAFLASIAGVSFAFLILGGWRRSGRRGRSAATRTREHVAPRTGSASVPTMRLLSGLDMPAVGYGTCCRDSARGKAVYKSTAAFLRLGGRLIDTAMAYRNHAEIGHAVRDSGIPRSEIWITSKVAPGRVRGYSACLVAVDEILEELGTDYLDLLLIHTPKLGLEPTVELWKCLIEARRLGKARSIGVSNFNRGEIEDVTSATGETPEANEIQMHPWSPPAWKRLARWQRDEGIVTIAYTSLGGSRFHRRVGGARWPPEVTKIAEEHGSTEAQVLLKWALKNGIAVIPGSGSEAHIEENLLLPDFDLSDAEVSDIESSEAPRDWWDERRGHQKYTNEEAGVPWEKRLNG